MPELVNHSASNPEFARVVELNRLRDAREFAFDVTPTEIEAGSVARLMGARSIRKMRFSGALTPLPAADVRAWLSARFVIEQEVGIGREATGDSEQLRGDHLLTARLYAARGRRD